MKKYIRTKDGKIVKINLEGDVFTSRYEIVGEPKDTIEELCDKYVLNKIDLIFMNKKHTKYHFENSSEWFDITDVELRYGIYGAIWTDKGLIYVAKMNEKGEFELI